METVYTNVPELSLDELRGFGKYLFIPGNTIRMDTNLAVIPQNAAALLETWNPNNNDQNYLVVSVDTTYPYVDSYSEESAQYRSVRNAFIMGIQTIWTARYAFIRLTGFLRRYAFSWGL